MEDYQAQSPVVLLMYNRPQKTALVFEEIARAKPKRLFVVADGPKQTREDEEKCAETRRLVDNVDWECQVEKVYSDVNLGCRRRVSTGLDAVFQKTDMAIILEDDCVPHASFFFFCDEMLKRYSDEERIGHISGCNIRGSYPACSDSYYFSRFPIVWGWATWRRAWRNYGALPDGWYDAAGKALLESIFDDRDCVRFWHKNFSAVTSGKLNSWATQWVYALWRNDLLSITPQCNLIRNIGFDSEATHTKKVSSVYDLSLKAMDSPLSIPPVVQRDVEADAALGKLLFTEPSFARKVVRKLIALSQSWMEGVRG